MSLVKKVFFLMILLLGFIVYSVYTFDYDTSLNEKPIVSNSANIIDTKNPQIGLLDKIINKFFPSEMKESKPFSFVLTKKDGMIIMDGIFSKEEDTKKVADILNINRDGEYSYEDGIVIDEVLLSKLATLVTPLKDFFEDGAKLSVINNEVFLSGDLKDSNYYSLLESIISRTDINLVKDIKISNPTLVNEENIQESLVNNSDTPEEKIADKVAKKGLNNSEIQQLINQLLVDKKIAFERKSSIVTEDSLSTLTKIAQILKENSSLKVEIAGFTDSRGESALNKKISQDRANGVKNALISLGIDKNRLTAVGYGEEFPIAKDDENGLSELNRRVEFKIIGE